MHLGLPGRENVFDYHHTITCTYACNMIIKEVQVLNMQQKTANQTASEEHTGSSLTCKFRPLISGREQKLEIFNALSQKLQSYVYTYWHLLSSIRHPSSDIHE